MNTGNEHLNDLLLIRESLELRFEMIEENTHLSDRDRSHDLSTPSYARIDKQTKLKWRSIQRGLRYVNIQIKNQETLHVKSDDVDIEHERHESYGMIQSTTPSGSKNLFGSTVNHQHYMSISISRAEVSRNLSKDWFHPCEELIEINMSHEQWGRFVSSTGTTGIPCTISRFDKRSVCAPKFINKRSQFIEEFDNQMKEISTELRAIESGLIAKLRSKETLKRGDRDEIANKIDRITTTLSNHMSFVARSWDETLEGSISEAKVEVESYVNSVIKQAGLSGIQNDAHKILSLGSNEDSKE